MYNYITTRRLVGRVHVLKTRTVWGIIPGVRAISSSKIHIFGHDQVVEMHNVNATKYGEEAVVNLLLLSNWCHPTHCSILLIHLTQKIR